MRLAAARRRPFRPAGGRARRAHGSFAISGIRPETGQTCGRPFATAGSPWVAGAKQSRRAERKRSRSRFRASATPAATPSRAPLADRPRPAPTRHRSNPSGNASKLACTTCGGAEVHIKISGLPENPWIKSISAAQPLSKRLLRGKPGIISSTQSRNNFLIKV